MMRDWKGYWDRHAATVESHEPFRQVQRVADKRAISVEAFDHVAHRAVELLDLRPEHVVLDLCCGNGLLSAALEPHCERVVAVDFCRRLLAEVAARTGRKTVAIVADARTGMFRPQSFDRVLIGAAIQHFEADEVVRLFENMAVFLRPGGVLVATEIPDAAAMWHFYDSPAREHAYFEGLAAQAPILGTWFDRAWLRKLARHAGFRRGSTFDQPPDFLYAHYRFDLRCRK